jgi:hypothetical protein
MKRVLLTAVCIAAFCSASLAGSIVAEGKTHSALGNYRIESLDQPVVLNGKELDAFTISYENTNMKVTVAVEKTRKCKTYYVLSDNLSVQYVCNSKYFGVQRLGGEFEKEGYSTSNEAMNASEYYHQRVLTSGGNTNLDNTKMIAAYFPFLLKDQEGVIAAK